MSIFKEYTVIGTKFTGLMVFKYHLNGLLASFELRDCDELDVKQKAWLFSRHFPYTENEMNNFRSIRTFTVTEGYLKVEFDDFWTLYTFKVGKFPAEKAWKKLKSDEKIKAIATIRPYIAHIARQRGQVKARASTYLNQKYFNDEWGAY